MLKPPISIGEPFETGETLIVTSHESRDPITSIETHRNITVSSFERFTDLRCSGTEVPELEVAIVYLRLACWYKPIKPSDSPLGKS